MTVSLREAKEYLRIDHEDEDNLILALIETAKQLCAAVLRVQADDLEDMESENLSTAILYTVAYLYEHREEADHHALTLTLRSLLFGMRKEGF